MSDRLEFEKQYRTILDKEEADYILVKNPDGTYAHNLIENAYKVFLQAKSK